MLELATQAGVNESLQVHFYVAGLKEPLAKRVMVKRPKKLKEAEEYAEGEEIMLETNKTAELSTIIHTLNAITKGKFPQNQTL